MPKDLECSKQLKIKDAKLLSIFIFFLWGCMWYSIIHSIWTNKLSLVNANQRLFFCYNIFLWNAAYLHILVIMLYIFIVNKVVLYMCFINSRKFPLMPLLCSFQKRPSSHTERKLFEILQSKYNFFLFFILDLFVHYYSQSHNIVTCPIVLTKPDLFLVKTNYVLG